MVTKISLIGLEGVQAIPCSVSVSEEGYTATVLEDEDGKVSIPELKGKINTGALRILGAALSVWKYGIVPC